jgi:hypothetical protein
MNESAAPRKSLMWWCATLIVFDLEGFFEEILGSIDFRRKMSEKQDI